MELTGHFPKGNLSKFQETNLKASEKYPLSSKNVQATFVLNQSAKSAFQTDSFTS